MRVLGVAIIGLALAGPALAEQAGAAGKPLAQYCNTVPDLSAQRSDAVDNWVKICTVWFAANRPAEPRPPRDDPRPKEGGEKKN